MSYVDLMGNARWSEADHVNRTEAIVREHWTAEDEAILNRKVVGYAIGQNDLSQQDLADIANFKAVTLAAQLAGVEARADAARLAAALDIEAVKQTLDAIPPAPQPTDDDPTPEDPYADQRAAAQVAYDSVYQAAAPDVQQLLVDRAAWRAAQMPAQPEEQQ